MGARGFSATLLWRAALRYRADCSIAPQEVAAAVASAFLAPRLLASMTDVRGKAVLVLVSRPTWTVSGQPWPSRSWEAKARTAADHGPVAMLLVPQPSSPLPVYNVAWRDPAVPYGADFPQAFLGLDAAGELVSESGVSLPGPQQAIDSAKSLRSIDLTSTAAIQVSAYYRASSQTSNVIAILKEQMRGWGKSTWWWQRTSIIWATRRTSAVREPMTTRPGVPRCCARRRNPSPRTCTRHAL